MPTPSRRRNSKLQLIDETDHVIGAYGGLNPQHLAPLAENDVHRNAGGRQAIQVGLKLGADHAFSLQQSVGPGIVSVALEGQDQAAQITDRLALVGDEPTPESH